MISTLYRRNGAPTIPAPVFDPDETAAYLIDPLESPVEPTWLMTEDGPEWLETVATIGDPRTLDDRVTDPRPVEVTVEVVDDADVELEAAPLALVDEPHAAETVALEAAPTVAIPLELAVWCPACEADAGDPCRTPSGKLRTIGAHVARTAGAA